MDYDRKEKNKADGKKLGGLKIRSYLSEINSLLCHRTSFASICSDKEETICI